MDIDYLIIGQGISGTLLSRELEKVNLSFLVIDEPKAFTASRVASGIINPVTGRRIVKTWMIDELLPFALNVYMAMGEELGMNCITEKSLLDFFPSPQMRLAFLDRLRQDPQYLSAKDDETSWNNYLNYDFGYGIIHPCYVVNLEELLEKYRAMLTEKDAIREEYFDTDLLLIKHKGIEYKDIRAKGILFCDGMGGYNRAYFKNLPFAPNKGEVLIVEIKDLPRTRLLKRSINIVPWKDDLFWVGSSHEWQFENDQPTPLFLQKTVAQLQQFLKSPFRVVHHWAAVRPATLERRPFVGLHPWCPAIGIFNGMGTKGCSLAPFFANQLARRLASGVPLLPQADVGRFKNLLKRE